MKNSFKTTFATALAVLTALSMTACKKTSNTEEMIVTENAVITDTVDVTGISRNIESVLKLQKPYVEKNTDIDLSKFTFDGVEYDFETMRYGDFLESTNTKPMGYSLMSYDENNFKSDLYGYARYKEDGRRYGTVYCMETEYDGYYNPIDNRYMENIPFSTVTDENKNDVKIHSFTVFETTGELDIILADGLLNYRTPTDKKEIIATLGEGTFVNDVDFLGYCDGKTVILFDLDSSGVRAERAIIYQLGEKE
ncbi:MAG: hypothetical protein IKL70_03305 [Oscillospiraceae bacterium]|nr:hypothetical protein [Oscillospiraceae bacterium]